MNIIPTFAPTNKIVCLGLKNSFCIIHTKGQHVPKETIRSDYFYVNLSKNIAYALRHKPDKCGLELDNYGYTTISSLFTYLRNLNKWKDISVSDIINAVAKCNKKRFEIKDDMIRALYGHSCKQHILKEPTQPPSKLYHGTSRSVIDQILKEGITSQTRQYVHLSEEIDTARQVGLRKDKNPIILVVDAEAANKAGNNFYIGNTTTWLADFIPPEFIKII